MSTSGDFYYNYNGYVYYYNPCGFINTYPCNIVGVTICVVNSYDVYQILGYNSTMQWVASETVVDVEYSAYNASSVVQIVCGSSPVCRITMSATHIFFSHLVLSVKMRAHTLSN